MIAGCTANAVLNAIAFPALLRLAMVKKEPGKKGVNISANSQVTIMALAANRKRFRSESNERPKPAVATSLPSLPSPSLRTQLRPAAAGRERVEPTPTAMSMA